MSVPLECSTPGSIGCIRTGSSLAEERAYGMSLLVVLQLQLAARLLSVAF